MHWKCCIDTLQKVKMLQNAKRHLVLWKRVFSDMGHICLEFEYLDKSLYDLMRERQFKHLQVKDIRPMVHQLASALDHLKCAHMIHANISLKNIMLIDHQQQPYRIKLGLAQGASVTKENANVHSHPYRSPEILLGAPYTEATDMWSVGCVAAFLYLGTHMYPGRKEYETIKCIMETQGPFPEDILVSGEKTCDFFHGDKKTITWRLKTPEHYQQVTGFAARDTRKIKLTSLNHLQQLRPWFFDAKHPADKDVYTDDKQMFVDMLKGMLRLNASQRLTPRHVLAHQFVTMSHLKPHHDVSLYAKSCYELMSHCEKEAAHISKRKSSTLQRTSSKISQKKRNSTTRAHKKSHDATYNPSKRLKTASEDYRTNRHHRNNQAKQPAGERSLSLTSNPSRLRSKDAKYIKLKTRFAARFMEEQSAMDENQTFQSAPARSHHNPGPGTKAWILGKDPPKSVL